MLAGAGDLLKQIFLPLSEPVAWKMNVNNRKGVNSEMGQLIKKQMWNKNFRDVLVLLKLTKTRLHSIIEELTIEFEL